MQKPNKKRNNKKYQNSDREALPLKIIYLAKADLIESINPIRSLYHRDL